MTNIADAVSDGIDALVAKKGDGWFLIFEETKGQNFVQFTYGASEGITFDLPVQALNGEEFESAKLLLDPYAITFESSPGPDEPDGKVVGEQKSFTKNIGTDKELAKILASLVFLEVYGIAQGEDICYEIDR